MKRLIMTLAAAACIAAPMAATVSTPAMAQRWDHDGDRGDRWDHGDRGDRGDRRGDRGDRRGDRDGRGERWSRGDDRDGRWDRDGRGERREAYWDQGRHNGYYYNNRWAYGRPPAAYLGSPGYRPGYNAWRRGAYLPNYYNSYVVNDYYRYRLRPPPRGYHWVRANDDYLLVAIASGLIFDIIVNGR